MSDKEIAIQQKEHIDIVLTEEFKKALDILENTSQHVFITGKAGTGKSTLLNYFRSKTKKNVVVVAPTGIAAINIKGQTIHSFFNFKPQFNEPGKKVNARSDMRKLYKQMDVLIIDEISMVRADIFEAIETFLSINGKEPGKKFGGCQICIIGDLYQLPPIINKNESEIYFHYYQTPYFFSARAFNGAQFNCIELTQIFRQSESHFIRFLNQVRANIVDRSTLEWFNNLSYGRKFNDGVSPIILTSINRIADDTNQCRLEEINQPSFYYKGIVKGSYGKDDMRLPTPLELQLKVGSQVMFVKNDKLKRWVNGTIGIICKLTANEIWVKVPNGKHLVDQEEWQAIKYQFDESKNKITENVIGSYKQFPLQLAWAVTIHKSQGKTFDNVIIDLGYGAFATGQTYVALSRCRTINGVSLKAPLKLSDIKVDGRITSFMQDFHNKQTYV